MNLDNYEIKIFELNRTYNLFNLSAKQGDTNGSRGILFKITKNNIPFSLENINIQVGGEKPDGTFILNDVEIIDRDNSIIEVDLTSQMLACDGILRLELNFIKDNIKLSSYPFEVEVIKSVSSFKTVVSSDEFEILNEALKKVDGYNEELTNAINTSKDEVYDKLEQDFSEIKKEGTNTVNNLNSMKDELQQSINGMNNNSTLNKLEELLKYNGIVGIDNTNINLKVERNKIYAVSSPIDNEIVAIDHSSMNNGDKCYFVIASTNPAVKLIFNKESLVNSGVYIVGNRNQEFNGRDNGDLIITLYKLGNCLRLAYDPSFGGTKEEINKLDDDIKSLHISNLIRNTGFLGARGGTNVIPCWDSFGGLLVYNKFGQANYDDPNTIYLMNVVNNIPSLNKAGIYQTLDQSLNWNTQYTLSLEAFKEPNVKDYSVRLEFYDKDMKQVDNITLIDKAINEELKEIAKTFTTKSDFTLSRIVIEHGGVKDTSVSARYLLIIKDLKLEEGQLKTGYTPSFDGVASLDRANAWTDGSYMKLKRDGHGFVTITGYKKITPNPKGTWTRINFPYSLKDANYTVQVTAFDGRSDNNFRSVKVGDTLTKDWCEVLAGDVFGFYYTITSSEKY
ncbi:MAG: BppU family phage baseplate upper protein [Clostridium sp.]|uniref:BppU family phage baseplate upper protein n=1 Tax=Clostridia TaxID=186801 RepID=UPI003F33D32E